MTFNYIPELDNHFLNHWHNHGELSIDNMKVPILEPNSSILPEASFLELLFSNVYLYDGYVYMFKEVPISSFSKSIRERLMYSSSLIKCYLSDINGTINLFSLESDDLLLLDKLLEYRIAENDTRYPDLSSIDYSTLSTNLSKLIFLYLDLVINNNFDNLNNLDLISSESSNLENLFEIYVTNETYKAISNWSFVIDTGISELRPAHDRFEVTDAILSVEKVRLRDYTYDFDIYVYWNSKLLSHENDEYDLIQIYDDEIGLFITDVSWKDKGHNIKKNDFIVVEYYVKVNDQDVGEDAYDQNITEIYQDSFSWWLDGGTF